MKLFMKRTIIILLFVLLMVKNDITAHASSNSNKVIGKIYEFEKKDEYNYSNSKHYVSTDANDTFGVFQIEGTIEEADIKGDIPSYKVSNGNLDFTYTYDDSKLGKDLDVWHISEDKSKKINGNTLSSDIAKGTIILQTSRDRKNWVDVVCETNVFSDSNESKTNSKNTIDIYITEDVQLINGCYYRLVVAYELQIRVEDKKFLFVNTDKYDYKKCAEVYEFYVYSDEAEIESTDIKEKISLGTRVRVADFDSYSGEQPIDADDPHKDWTLGEFYVSGFTGDVNDSNNNKIFLKDVGDKVVLWFRLDQDIDILNGKDNLSITADEKGYDEYFEKGPMDFGKGALFIRYTDRNNIKSDVITYINFLEANTVVGADTKVQLFEEGDYEVALDYEITDNQLIDKVSHYRIAFKFSIRNNNCMVYPFDVATGSELTNSSMTENGFRLDLAKSRYLNVYIKREVMKDSADGLVEDTRFNGAAKEGREYTDEGIYTITVSNEYTGQTTTKKLYVGTNDVLRAHMATGKTIPEINELLEQGATISETGMIELPVVISTEEPSTKIESPTTVEEEPESILEVETQQVAEVDSEQISIEEKNFDSLLPNVALLIVLICLFGCIALKKNESKKSKGNRKEEE